MKVNLTVEFLGELGNDRKIRDRFVRQYNKACNVVNGQQQGWNETFDAQWMGGPIEDYAENVEYHQWMLARYREAITKAGLTRDLFLNYDYDEDLQFYATGRFGRIKNRKIWFVLREG